MKFSIIIPIYNVENYIKKCIESVMNQTYDDYELILVNDGTKDNSMQIVNDIITCKTLNYTIINKENGGLGSARNEGIRAAKGDYLVFLDSDDYISSNLLERVNQVISTDDSDLVCFNSMLVSETGKILDKYDMCEKYGSNIVCDNAPEILLTPPAAWNKVCKRELFLNTDCWYLEGQVYEDTLVSRALMCTAKNITFIQDYLYFYVQRGSSIMNGPNKKVLDMLPANEQLISWFKKKQLFRKYYYELQTISVRTILFYALDIINMSSIKDPRQATMTEFITNNYDAFLDNPYLSKADKKRVRLLLSNHFMMYYIRYGTVKKIKLLVKRMIHR